MNNSNFIEIVYDKNEKILLPGDIVIFSYKNYYNNTVKEQYLVIDYCFNLLGCVKIKRGNTIRYVKGFILERTNGDAKRHRMFISYAENIKSSKHYVNRNLINPIKF